MRGGPARGAGIVVAAVVTLLGARGAFAAPSPPTADNPHGELEEKCNTCHGASAWKPARIDPGFDHSKLGFPLEGAHSSTNCKSCHASLVFAEAEASCSSCHEDAHHGEMGEDCARCHTTQSFDDRAGFERLHQASRFPLTGEHVSVECESCHSPTMPGHLQFIGLSIACSDCHLAESRAVQQPDHTAAGFPSACETCHSTGGWENALFDHAATQFPLTGEHAYAACVSCHAGGVFGGLPTDCNSCHASDFDEVTEPNHVAAGFPRACETCHSTSGWDGAIFDHAVTQFPLTGAHVSEPCLACHASGAFDGLATDCNACHASDFDGVTDPNHVTAGFPRGCEACHNTNGWEGAIFDHAVTQFPLTGAHVSEPCLACHASGAFDGLATDCNACHASDFDGTPDPNHAASDFSRACETCHTTAIWTGARFTQHDPLFFPVYAGRHANRWDACSDCHQVSTDYSSFTCLSCHPHSDQQETDGHHRESPDYAYESHACYSCHPDGRSD